MYVLASKALYRYLTGCIPGDECIERKVGDQCKVEELEDASEHDKDEEGIHDF
jgi:hypothetical protein